MFDIPLRFAGCYDGKLADCTKPDNACDDPDPKCSSLGPDYRVKWVGGCHEGCVRVASCD